MAAMTKRVNINAPVAIRNITPPIYGVCKNVIMSTGDILKCLCKRAIVDEILPDGSTVRLNMRNYYTDNGAGLDASRIAVVEDVKNESIAQDEEPAAAVVADTDPTNVPGVVNETEDEDNTASVVEDNSNDNTVDESATTEEISVDTDGQIEEDTEETVASSDDVADEESVTTVTEDAITDTENKVEESATETETVKEEKSEVAEKKPATKSTSSTKKKNSNSNSKKKTTSSK